MFLQYILRIIGLLVYLCQALPSLDTTDDGHGSVIPRAPKQGGGASRDVWIFQNFDTQGKVMKPNGLADFASHSALFIESTDQDLSMKWEILHDGDDWYWQQWVGYVPETTPPPTKVKFYQGKTTMTNNDILSSKGTGPAWDALVADPEYRTGQGNKGKFNTCHDFAARMLNGMNMQVTSDAASWMAKYGVQTMAADSAAPVKKLEVWKQTDNPRRPKFVKRLVVPKGAGSSKAGSSSCRKRDGACSPPESIEDTSGQDSPTTGLQNEMITLPEEVKAGMDPSVFEAEVLSPPNIDPDAKPPPDGTVETDKGVTVSLARSGGTLSRFVMVSKAALGALGVAGTIAGAVFVILDYVHHQWVGAGIGTAGLLAGVAAGIALGSGPVGWIVGGIIALFASKLYLVIFVIQAPIN